MRKLVLTILFCYLSLLGSSVSSEECEALERPTLRFSIGESWEPYYSEELEGGGVVVDIVRKAFERVGYSIDISWYPWARALNMAKIGDHDGLIGAWYTDERTNFFKYSEPFLSTEIVVIKRSGDSVVYDSMGDLNAYRVGVALDSAPYDLLIENDIKDIDIGLSATRNIQKLFAKRFDVLVDEKLNVFNIINTQFPEWQNEVEVLSPPLQVNNLHLIVSFNTKNWESIIAAFNQGLSEIRKDGTFGEILVNHGMAD